MIFKEQHSGTNLLEVQPEGSLAKYGDISVRAKSTEDIFEILAYILKSTNNILKSKKVFSFVYPLTLQSFHFSLNFFFQHN